MAGASKNSRTTVATHNFFCSCGGEVAMKTMFENGRLKNVAECSKCNRVERRPKDFKSIDIVCEKDCQDIILIRSFFFISALQCLKNRNKRESRV
jgi:hypothetical protein